MTDKELRAEIKRQSKKYIYIELSDSDINTLFERDTELEESLLDWEMESEARDILIDSICMDILQRTWPLNTEVTDMVEFSTEFYMEAIRRGYNVVFPKNSPLNAMLK